MLVNMIDMLNKAKLEKYAVPQFNINNLEWTRFILEECEENKSPVILGVSEGAAKYMGGFRTVYHIVNDLIEYLNKFDMLNGDPSAIISEITNKIKENELNIE